MELAKEIWGLEQQVWSAVIQGDREELRRLFSEDYVEITLEGRRVERAEVVRESPQVDDIKNVQINSETFHRLGEECALLSYHLALEGTCRGEPISPVDRWVTSIWTLNGDGEWRCRFFQQSHFCAPD